MDDLSRNVGVSTCFCNGRDRFERFNESEEVSENFTPKQVAVALHVSESSVKRWCDQGAIRTDRTLGGHRRIPLEFLLEFLEATNRRVIDPDAIGMPKIMPSIGSAKGRGLNKQFDRATILEGFKKSLLSGSESECRRALGEWYANTGSIASVADGLIAPAFREVGEAWACGSADIYEERRGCEICMRLFHELRRLLPEPQGAAPLAMGGTPAGDRYQLPSQLLDMVFREQGWRTIGLGSDIPYASHLSAARKHMPKIFWLSVSHIENKETFLKEFNQFSRGLPKGLMLLVGGCALTDAIRPSMSFSAHCDSLEQVSTLARTIKSGTPLPSPQI